MKQTCISLLLLIPFGLMAQHIKKADALVHPRVARKTISVGGEDAHIKGFTNHSIQYAIDALEKSGGTVILDPGQYSISAPVR